MLTNNFGNYVVQKALKFSNDKDKIPLISNIYKHLDKIKHSKIQQKWQNLIENSLTTLDTSYSAFADKIRSTARNFEPKMNNDTEMNSTGKIASCSTKTVLGGVELGPEFYSSNDIYTQTNYKKPSQTIKMDKIDNRKLCFDEKPNVVHNRAKHKNLTTTGSTKIKNNIEKSLFFNKHQR